MKFLNARKNAYHTDPKLIDEVIYSPYLYQPSTSITESRQTPAKSSTTRTEDLLGIPELVQEEEEIDGQLTDGHATKKKSKFDATTAEAEIFLFEYGTVVLWGMTEAQEKRFLSSM